MDLAQSGVELVTLAELQTELLRRAGEDPAAPVYFTAARATAALNWAQRLFVMATRCLETEGPMSTAGGPWLHLRASFADYLCLLRVEVNGARLRPARVADLAALDSSYETTAGDVTRYAHAGADSILFYKQASVTATVTYARLPATLSSAGASPEIPAEYHPLLVDAGLVFLRLAEGGQEFAKVRAGLAAFVAGAEQLAAYVEKRSLDQRYDPRPLELKRLDLSRLIGKAKRPTPHIAEGGARAA